MTTKSRGMAEEMIKSCRDTESSTLELARQTGGGSPRLKCNRPRCVADSETGVEKASCSRVQLPGCFGYLLRFERAQLTQRRESCVHPPFTSCFREIFNVAVACSTASSVARHGAVAASFWPAAGCGRMKMSTFATCPQRKHIHRRTVKLAHQEVRGT